MKKINRRKFLQSSSLLGVSALAFGSTTLNRFSLRSNGFDVLIKNGKIIDGTGRAEYSSDIGIKDGKILAIGNLNSSDALKIIDAKGLKAVPGFIDIHSHTDVDLILNPKAESKIRQGVTTEVTGQDGFSWGPLGGPELDKTLKNFKEEYGEDLSCRTLKEFLDNFSSRKFSPNLITMLGLGTIREVFVGLDNRPATKDEMNLMFTEVVKGIEAGAVGVSTGLEYTPGSFASTEELIELCKAVPEKYRLYATHMRNEDDTVLEAIDEAIKIARESGSRLQISHLKVSGKSNWYKADEALEKIDKAIAEGIEVHADRYPYVAYATGLSNYFPLWSRDGGTEKFMERLKDSSLKDKIKQYADKKASNLDGDWNGILISNIPKDDMRIYQGKTIKQIADENGLDYYDAAVKLILDSENSVDIVGFGMEEKSTEKIIAHPRVMIASDYGSHAPYPPMNKTIAHPRSYGTFPRSIAKYVRERKICSLEEMIKKMTSMPADKINLSDRGRIEEGRAADVVLFDYDKIQDKATYTDPHQYPDGIPYVIVNGEVVIHQGEHTGAFPGKVIRNL
ncbi:MAG: D-aminoacylase [Bacteroidetes bacterium]|nr:D-aminoacylase [Bacteroidota bacterium]